MRTLFSLVSAVPSGRVFDRPSVRAIILRGGRIAMVHSLKYDYYKFPGGGIEAGESHLEALLREAREEAGLRILPESVREYGVVPRAEREPGGGSRKTASTPGNMIFSRRTIFITSAMRSRSTPRRSWTTMRPTRATHPSGSRRKRPLPQTAARTTARQAPL